jgi:hypothetical protein
MPDPDAPELPDASRLRALLSAHRPAWWGAGYPPEIRTEVAAWAQPLHDDGHGWSVLAAAVGVSRNSLRSWCAQRRADATPREHPAAQWLPVRVADPACEPPTASRPVLVTPSGFQVENLGDDLLLRILRELA